MLSAIEKMQILRTVAIFSETPEEILRDVAAILEQVDVPSGARIVEKGEHSTCMYIIADGKVRVHDGEYTLNYLEKSDVFGEMAALDAEPRVASVTALTDTQLLRLDQQPLYRLMSRRIDIVYSIIHVLCQRLRNRAQDVVERKQAALELGTRKPVIVPGDVV